MVIPAAASNGPSALVFDDFDTSIPNKRDILPVDSFFQGLFALVARFMFVLSFTQVILFINSLVLPYLIGEICSLASATFESTLNWTTGGICIFQLLLLQWSGHRAIWRYAYICIHTYVIYEREIDRVHSMPARWFHSLTLLESSMMNCVPC